MIGGVSVRSDGDVDVVDDPALLEADEPLGHGRMFRVGGPVAPVTARPGRRSDQGQHARLHGDGRRHARVQAVGSGPAGRLERLRRRDVSRSSTRSPTVTTPLSVRATPTA